MSKENSLAEDLDYVLDSTKGLWDELRGQRIFITGGTGFFGRWLLESFIRANERLGLGATACVLTRDAEGFRKRAPQLAAHPAVALHAGDIRAFSFPAGTFSHVIHAATDASARLNEDDPLLMLDTIVEGTRRALEFAGRCEARKFLLVSSGAVYGRQPPELTHVPEEYAGAPDALHAGAAYGEGKRVAEFLCGVYHRQHGLETKIARCFAFLGPYLPLDVHFAVGNFIRDGLGGGPVRVGGDGTPYRSYLYAADLAIWLWHILFRGAPARPYNVGSDAAVTIAELARMVADTFTPSPEVVIARSPAPGKPAERYVPSVRRAAAELNLQVGVDLRAALERTVTWHLRRVAPGGGLT